MAEGWARWTGRTEVRTGRVDAELAARWSATLDREPPADGSVAQGIHWCLMTPDAPTASLGADGHPIRDEDGFLPPIPLPRRMWASSEVSFVRPLRAGEPVSRESRIEFVTEKHGGSGRLVFVTVSHLTSDPAGIAVRETQAIVYREAAPADAPPTPPPPSEKRFDPGAWAVHRTVVPSAALLFRYSALTFNSHRIHYDAPYATGTERYRGLVVHGPLTATLLLDLARREYGDQALAQFAFRGASAAIADEPLHLVLRGGGDALELGAFAADGRQVMVATGALRAGDATR